MKVETKVNFCFLCCFLAFGLSLLTLMLSSLDLANAQFENEYLAKKIEQQDAVIEEYKKEVELYKQHCDDVVRCVISGEW